MKHRTYAVSSLVCLALLTIVVFQNCGEGFAPALRENLSASTSAETILPQNVDLKLSNDVQVPQGEEAMFKIESTAPATQDIRIKIKTVGATARPGYEYVEPASTVILKEGTSSVDVPIRTSIKNLLSADASFAVEIESVTAGNVTKASATATIPKNFSPMKFKKITASLLGFGYCAVTMSDEVVCWGTRFGDSDGSLKAIAGATNAIDVAVGGSHGCALIQGGTAKCWGRNDGGQLGTVAGADSPLTAVDVPNIAGATQISADGATTCVVLSDATLKCWGELDVSTVTPYPVSDMGLTDVKAVSVVGAAWCALHNDGTVSCLGYNFRGILGDGTTTNRYFPLVANKVPNFTGAEILFPGNGICAKKGSDLYCWGGSPRVLIGSTLTTPMLVPTNIGPFTNLKSIRTDFDHSCVVTMDGKVQCGGSNTYGQLGNGTILASSSLTSVASSSVTDVAISGFNTCLLTGEATIRCFGSRNPTLGPIGSALPGQPYDDDEYPMNPLQISIGIASLCALTAVGDVFCAGSNTEGQIGANSTAGVGTYVPMTKIAGTGAPYKKVVSGSNFHCALRADKNIDCWGAGLSGQLGNNGQTSSATPVMVSGLANVKDLAAGATHVCAIDANDAVWCWGSGTEGKLGGNTSMSLIPRQANVSGAKRLALGTRSSCASLNDGTASCWGLIPGSTLTSVTPVAVQGSAGHKALDIEGTHACLIGADESVNCWGSNTFGESGVPVATTALVGAPAAVGTLKAKSLALGTSHSCVVDMNDRVQCFGNNVVGQLGNGTKVASSTPVTALGVTNVKSIASGPSIMKAVLNDGVVRTWPRTTFSITRPDSDFGTRILGP